MELRSQALPDRATDAPPAEGTPHMTSVEEIVQTFEDADAQPVDLSGYAAEDWFTVGLFWIMTLLVFMQFFTRYVMNDSLAWTEELATYCLIGVVFIGASMCVRKSRHIQVDLIYRYLPHGPARVLSTLVDVLRTAFLGYAAWLVWKYIGIVGDEPMTTIDWNKNHVYWAALLGFVLMLGRSIQVTWQNWRNGYSILERPEAFESFDD
ncbi:TRAP-type C4-dicarboxylate transport system, small permease component [Cupriavidus sp. U2]|jgi:TRAP-type C4-dicarboxylate transport system permease small subunit|uniref:TRAP transporter small permease n=1 Tax=Cupriavidus sp. U2 TaxID=2920269 RepID=UPI00129DDB1C|nr:TRAP transporter small permease [Cupriavidus sp. U2]KAI3589487.1 TRAP-type C4-dicarboxylate transport system, small permease component [Cupriavidus sp. U2]